MAEITPIIQAELLDALTHACEAAYVWSLDTDCIDWLADPVHVLQSPELFGLSTGSKWRAAFTSGDSDARDAWIADVRRPKFFRGVHRLGSAESGIWVEESLVRISNADSGAARYLGRLRNVSEQHRRLEKLTYLAFFDDLTGLLSRAQFRTLLSRRMARAQEEDRSLSFGMIGLDNLASYNTMFGYDIADFVLVKIGEVISRYLGPSDAMGRIGSSKFAIIFGNTTRDELHNQLHAIQAEIRNTVIETGAGPLAVTVSAAGLLLPDDAATTQDVLAIAEDTLNEAKSAGLDQIALHRPNCKISAQRLKNIALADDLVAAVRENRLRLAFQPVVQASDPTQVAFYECLLRLVDRDGSVVPAGAFVPVAEKLGLVRMLDRRVLELAFETLRANERVRLSVNISPQSLRDKRWSALFERLAEQNPTALERLILEVTEATVIEDAEDAAVLLNRYRDMGCSIALDDFGAGYTSFQQFKQLTIDIVKIDGGYIRDVVDSLSDQVFIKALCGIAKFHELLIVAEMVDSDAAGLLLRDLGVDTFQGFHFGRPELIPSWLGQDEVDNIMLAVAGRAH